MDDAHVGNITEQQIQRIAGNTYEVCAVMAGVIIQPNTRVVDEGSVCEHNYFRCTTVCPNGPESGILKMNSKAIPAVQSS